MSTAGTISIVKFLHTHERRLSLNYARKFLFNRLSLLLALLAILATSLAGPLPCASASCPDRANIRYYSDATYTTQVGYCYHNCCELWTCTGQLTDYYIVRKFPCDFN
jgi:hypothetical protein